MNTEQRKFHSLMFLPSKATSTIDWHKMLPKEFVFDGEPVRSEGGRLAIHRAIYYTKKQYSLSPSFEDLKVRWNGSYYYRLIVYFLAYHIGSATFIFVCVPFSSMLRDVLSVVGGVDNIRNVRYLKLNLDDLIAMMHKGIGKYNALSCGYLEVMLFGDSDCKLVSLRGGDVTKSHMFKQLQLMPHVKLFRKARLRHQSENGGSYSLIADRFGNYSLWVGIGGGNLLNSIELISFLADSNYLKVTNNFPPDRIRDNSEEHPYGDI